MMNDMIISNPRSLLFYVSDNFNPHGNIAFEYHMFKNCPDDAVCIFLWANDKTVVVGKNQNVFSEVNVAKLDELGGVVARRLTGGGAVYHDKNNLNFSFAAKKGVYDVKKQLGIIARALEKWGITAEISGRNDMTVDGKKFSGNAFLSEGGFSLHHGTVMLKTDVGVMSEVLTVDQKKLQSKGVKSVRSRVVNLTEVNPQINREQLVEQIFRCAEDIYGVKGERMPYVLDSDAQATAEWLGSKEWLFNRVVDKGEGATLLKQRFEWGGVELSFMRQGDRLLDLRIFSDALDVDEVERIEKTLGGTKLSDVRADSQMMKDIFNIIKETL